MREKVSMTAYELGFTMWRLEARRVTKGMWWWGFLESSWLNRPREVPLWITTYFEELHWVVVFTWLGAFILQFFTPAISQFITPHTSKWNSIPLLPKSQLRPTSNKGWSLPCVFWWQFTRILLNIHVTTIDAAFPILLKTYVNPKWSLNF